MPDLPAPSSRGETTKPADAGALDDAEIARLLGIARRAADAAARITLDHFRVDLAIDDKSGTDSNVASRAPSSLFDPVTFADREAERVMRELFARECPDVGFIGEESAPGGGVSGDVDGVGTAPVNWVVDPIDGTRAYISGMPLWGTLIALNDRGEIRFGLLDQPFLGERFEGTAAGTTLADRRGRRALRTRATAALADAVLYCTSPDIFSPGEELHAFERVAAASRLVRYGGDCYAYAMLAAGRVDLVVEAGLAPWDIQALVPIVRGAGGTITDWRGGDPAGGGAIVAAGDARLHAETLSLLSGHP